jgi:hypothetical protein
MSQLDVDLISQQQVSIVASFASNLGLAAALAFHADLLWTLQRRLTWRQGRNE